MKLSNLFVVFLLTQSPANAAPLAGPPYQNPSLVSSVNKRSIPVEVLYLDGDTDHSNPEVIATNKRSIPVEVLYLDGDTDHSNPEVIATNKRHNVIRGDASQVAQNPSGSVDHSDSRIATTGNIVNATGDLPVKTVYNFPNATVSSSFSVKILLASSVCLQ